MIGKGECESYAAAVFRACAFASRVFSVSSSLRVLHSSVRRDTSARRDDTYITHSTATHITQAAWPILLAPYPCRCVWSDVCGGPVRVCRCRCLWPCPLLTHPHCDPPEHPSTQEPYTYWPQCPINVRYIIPLPCVMVCGLTEASACDSWRFSCSNCWRRLLSSPFRAYSSSCIAHHPPQ